VNNPFVRPVYYIYAWKVNVPLRITQRGIPMCLSFRHVKLIKCIFFFTQWGQAPVCKNEML